MGPIELIDESAAAAIERAAALHDSLRSVDGMSAEDLQKWREGMHELVGDIVSLRNAAELLKRGH
jgi:soluble cytochrome b562